MPRQLNITLPPRDPTLDLEEDFEYQDALLLTCTALLLEAGFSVVIIGGEQEMSFEDWELNNA